MNTTLPFSPDRTQIAGLRANLTASIAASPFTLEEIRERSGMKGLTADVKNCEQLTMTQLHRLSVTLGMLVSDWFRVTPV